MKLVWRLLAIGVIGLAWFGLRCTPTGGVEFAFDGGFARWREEGSLTDELLRDGAAISLFRLRPMGSHPPESFVLRLGPVHRAVKGIAGLANWVKPIDSPERAIRYSTLLRLFDIGGESVPGEALEPNPPTKTSTGFGWYSLADSSRWDIPQCPEAVAARDGSFVVLRPVFVDDEAAASLGVAEPAVVLLEERIGLDGAYAAALRRVLESGAAARPYGSRMNGVTSRVAAFARLSSRGNSR